MGSVLGTLDWLTLGLLPDELVTTRDQAILLESDNVVSEAASRDGRTLQGLGITPTTIEAIVPSYLLRFRKTGQFDLKRNAPTDDAGPARSAARGGPDPTSTRSGHPVRPSASRRAAERLRPSGIPEGSLALPASRHPPRRPRVSLLCR